MAYQIVLSGNRVISYGANCFISVGGTVICTTEPKVYANATIAECDSLPADIGRVGYEYHAGEFVPCAPYGTGTGNIAVVCDDCKTIKDSGQSMSYLGRIAEFEYTGVGRWGSENPCSVTVDFSPCFAIITRSDPPGYFTGERLINTAVAFLSKQGGVSFIPASNTPDSSITEPDCVPLLWILHTSFNENTIEWYCDYGETYGAVASSKAAQCNISGETYSITVFGHESGGSSLSDEQMQELLMLRAESANTSAALDDVIALQESYIEGSV